MRRLYKYAFVSVGIPRRSPLTLYGNGHNEHTSGDDTDKRTTMVKTLRADMDEEAFYEFKGLFGKLGATTNDEAIEELVSFYKEHEASEEDKIDE